MELKEFTVDDCLRTMYETPADGTKSNEGKVCIIPLENLAEEYRRPEYQLFRVSGGFWGGAGVGGVWKCRGLLSPPPGVGWGCFPHVCRGLSPPQRPRQSAPRLYVRSFYSRYDSKVLLSFHPRCIAANLPGWAVPHPAFPAAGLIRYN